MNIPKTISAGDSVSWKDDATSDNLGRVISSDTWTLRYAIRGSSPLNLVAVADSKGWLTSLTAAQTTGLVPGFFFWQAFATSGSERVTLGTGRIEVLANLQTAGGGFDGRNQARKDLDAVQAAMRSMIAGGAVAEYTIGNRSVKKMTMTDLMAMESKLKYDVAREERAESIKNGLGNPHTVFVRFR